MDTHVSLVSTCVWIYQHICLHVECLVWLASNVCVCVLYMCMCVCTCSTSCFVQGVYLAVVHRRVEEVGEEEWGKDWGRGV